MYAIVRSGSKQQKVAVGDVIEIDKVATAPGELLTLPVVMVVDGEKVTWNSTVATTKKASTTATSPGRRQTRRRSRASRARKPSSRCSSRERRAGTPRSAWVAAIARPPCGEMLLQGGAKGRLRRRVERVQRLVEQPERRLRSATTRASATRRRWPADRVRTGRSRQSGRDRRRPARRPARSAAAPPRSRSATRKVLAHREVALEAVEMAEPGQPAAPGLGLGLHVGALPADGPGIGPRPAGPARAAGWSCRCRCGRSGPEARRRPGRRTGGRRPGGRRGGRQDQLTSRMRGGAMRRRP